MNNFNNNLIFKGASVKKPELKDFGLTEELLKQNKSEHETYYERLESHLRTL